MIVRNPDPELTRGRLERIMAELRDEASSRDTWALREKYVDRGSLEPHYILDFRGKPERAGDDLLSEPLFYAGGGFSIKNLTRRPPEKEYPYWITISRADLLKRLERFMRMYRENFIQPPGYVDDAFGRRKEHPRFEKRAFIYRLSSPRSNNVGVGPAMFAGGEGSALYGRVLDSETNKPSAFALVELVSKTVHITRTTNADGYFWFSRVPPGDLRLLIQGREHTLRVLDREPFGKVRATIVNMDNQVMPEIVMSLKAPDDEIFTAYGNSDGVADTGPIPGFPYTLRIPDHLFTAAIQPGGSATIAGTLQDEKGVPLKGVHVLLKEQGLERTRTEADDEGAFRFGDLAGGPYSLEVPGYLIFARRLEPSRMDGGILNAEEPVMLELVLRDVVAAKTTAQNGAYAFDNLAPGEYVLGSPNRDIAPVDGE